MNVKRKSATAFAGMCNSTRSPLGTPTTPIVQKKTDVFKQECITVAATDCVTEN
jgi:hypothetical protein